jgi:hypothetical protein
VGAQGGGQLALVDRAGRLDRDVNLLAGVAALRGKHAHSLVGQSAG